jgi:HAE1 family hydrophobic/amphiphilic exporter-1
MGLGIMQLSQANTIAVERAVRAELERLSKRFPPGLRYGIAFDTTTVVSESIREVLQTLLMAIVFVVLTMFLFLEDWRSTLIPAVTIPVSLVGTFFFVKLMGFSINTLTLFGITLATGLVVDDAIVVIENVKRHMGEEHISAHAATSEAMGEVTGAVIATSLVLVAVFVPVGFFPGTTGRLYQQFSLTIAFSIALSAFNSLTFTPALSALILEGEKETKGGFFARVEAARQRLTAGYSVSLHHALARRYPLIVVFFLGLGATWWLFRVVPRSFVPDEDSGWFLVNVQGPEGASLNYTTRVLGAVEATLLRERDVASAMCVGGFSFGGASPNRGIIFVNMRPIAERKGEPHSVYSAVNRLRGPLGAITEATVVPFLPPALEGVGAFGGFQFEVQAEGASLQQLFEVTRDLMNQGNARPDLRGLFSSFTANDPQFLVTIDREKAKRLQVPLGQITDALQIFMGSAYVNDFDFNNRSYRVYVQADQAFRSKPQDIAQFYVRSGGGAMVPLENLVTVTETASPQIISHYNLFRSSEINGIAAPGYSSGQAIQAMEELARRVLPVGFSYSWSGLSLEEIESGGQSLLLFGLGLLVVYLTLAAQYESFVLPFIILLGVPMALLGALGAQGLRGLQNDVYCQIGLVMLIGLASKNGILIVEFAEQLRRRGLSITEAAAEAARIRLRPILMTSFAFILGVLPLVLASGAGKASRHSVGTTVFGGMILSSVLNLLFIPVLYVMIRTVTERVRGLAAAPAPVPGS